MTSPVRMHHADGSNIHKKMYAAPHYRWKAVTTRPHKNSPKSHVERLSDAFQEVGKHLEHLMGFSVHRCDADGLAGSRNSMEFNSVRPNTQAFLPRLDGELLAVQSQLVIANRVNH